MTTDERDGHPALLQQRLDIVAAISRVNAFQLRNWQLHGGAEIEISYFEQVIESGNDSEAHRAALVEVRQRLQQVNAMMAHCEEELAVLHGRLQAIDDVIAGG